MVLAKELKAGVAIRIETQVYRVLDVDSKAGSAKMGGVVRAKLRNVKSGRLWEQHFRPQERLEELELQRLKMAFLYSDGISCTLQNAETFEQIEVPATMLGPAEKFLESGTELLVDFFEQEPINVVAPEVVECRVASTASTAHSQPSAGNKEATLENGLTLLVPLFIASGELVRIDVRTGRYLDRVLAEHKKSA